MPSKSLNTMIKSECIQSNSINLIAHIAFQWLLHNFPLQSLYSLGKLQVDVIFELILDLLELAVDVWLLLRDWLVGN